MFGTKSPAITPVDAPPPPPTAAPVPAAADPTARAGSTARGAVLGALASVALPPAASFVASWIRDNGLSFTRRRTRLQRLGDALAANRGLLLGGAGLVAAGALVRWQLARLFTETPAYEIERTVGDVEIRRYPARLVAETTVETGSFRDALGVGFRRLADYIFGENVARARAPGGLGVAAGGAAPARPADDGEAIAMTTPVTTVRDGNGWKMAFNLPKDYAPGTLPEPTDARVRIRQEPARRIAALRFTGGFDHTRIEAAELDLLTKLADAGLEPVGEPAFAGYDGPTTLPFLRRNEAWVVLEDDPASTAAPRFGGDARA